jgi:phage tail-like protein
MPPSTAAGTGGSGGLGAAHHPSAELLFRAEIDGIALGRFSACSGLSMEWETAYYAEGGNNAYLHGLRGRMRHTNVLLSRGVTSEDALLRWFCDVQAAAKRPTLTVAMLAPSGADLRRFAFAAAYPVRWSGPVLRTNSVGGADETLEIGHQGLVA